MGSLHGLVGVQAGEADGTALEGAQVDEHEGARRAEVWQGWWQGGGKLMPTREWWRERGWRRGLASMSQVSAWGRPSMAQT